MDQSHFIPLHSALKLKKLLSINFRNPFLLCCVSFCLLGEIFLVSRIQMAFARRKRSSYARVGKMDFQHPVPVCKTSLFMERSLLMLHSFAFRQFFPKRKAFSDIHRNVGLVCSVMIRQRRSSNCSNPVITCPLGRLANLSPSGALRPRVIN